MGKNTEFILRQKIEDLIIYAIPALEYIPKTRRVLLERIELNLYEMLEIAIELEKKYYKKTSVRDLDIKKENVQKLIAIAANPKINLNKAPCLPFKKYQHMSERLTEIGKIIGGYQKSVVQ